MGCAPHRGGCNQQQDDDDQHAQKAMPNINPLRPISTCIIVSVLLLFDPRRVRLKLSLPLSRKV